MDKSLLTSYRAVLEDTRIRRQEVEATILEAKQKVLQLDSIISYIDAVVHLSPSPKEPEEEPGLQQGMDHKYVPIKDRVMDVLQGNPPLTTRQVSEKANITLTQAQGSLNYLQSRDQAIRDLNLLWRPVPGQGAREASPAVFHQ